MKKKNRLTCNEEDVGKATAPPMICQKRKTSGKNKVDAQNQVEEGEREKRSHILHGTG